MMSFFSPGPVRVKICGITNAADADMAVDAGADALGFNFYPGSKRYLDFAENRDWIAALAGQVTRVAVVVNASPGELAVLRDSSCFEAVQFHGDEAPADCVGSGFPLWIRAVRVKDAGSAAAVETYPTPFVLLDAYSESEYGGTGRRLNWDLARELVLTHPDRHIILAGGLTPSTICDAVRIARPHAVDVAGGVEADPRRKDEYAVREFVRLARSA